MPRIHLVAAAALLVLVAGCFPFRESRGGGQTAFVPPRTVDARDLAVPDGYVVELVAEGLTFPTGIAFDRDGTAYVTESGYAYGERFTVPRLVRIGAGGAVDVVRSGGAPPWNGLDVADGTVYVAEGGVLEGGRILALEAGRGDRVLVDGLPSMGDHHTNAPLVIGDWVYFTQGVVTNAAVVGVDSYDFGWLPRFPRLADVPCEDVTLTGRAFDSPDPLGPPGARATTGAFMPFGTAAEPGQVVPGRLPCNGAILRVPRDGGDVELVAWGLRNPFGLALHPDGTLYATDNLYDDRGSRGVFGAGDLLWRIEPGTWYGWPDYHGSRPLTDADHYRPPGRAAPGFVLAHHPNVPPEPAAVLAVHSSSNGFDFSRAEAFGHVGEAFVAQFGDMAPNVGRVLAPAGFRVVRVDVDSGVVQDFMVNRAGPGPASFVGGRGLERPVAARFDPSGTALYVVDFGVMVMGPLGPVAVPETGVIWRVRKEAAP